MLHKSLDRLREEILALAAKAEDNAKDEHELGVVASDFEYALGMVYEIHYAIANLEEIANRE